MESNQHIGKIVLTWVGARMKRKLIAGNWKMNGNAWPPTRRWCAR